MYEFDMMGRLYAFYVLDNQFHHSIWQWDSSTIVAPSEYTAGRPDALHTNEDGVSVVDLTTGLEIAYYDLAKILDPQRESRPSGTAPGEDPTVKDWLHINQSYVNETNNLLITSGRHQSAVFGIDLAHEATAAASVPRRSCPTVISCCTLVTVPLMKMAGRFRVNQGIAILSIRRKVVR